MFSSAKEVLHSLFEAPCPREIKILKDHNSYGDGSGINIMIETSTGLWLFYVFFIICKNKYILKVLAKILKTYVLTKIEKKIVHMFFFRK